MIPCDTLVVAGGTFTLVRKDGCQWTWLNTSIGETFEIEYQLCEMEDAQ